MTPEPAPAPRPPVDSPLLRRLEMLGHRFSFFQAVWLLERLHAGAQPVGQTEPRPAEEAIRFRPDVSMGFPPTDVRRIRRVVGPDGAVRHLVEVSFMGLYGVSSPLPCWYPQYVLRTVSSANEMQVSPPHGAAAAAPAGTPPDETSPVRELLDVVHHRLISLFYRAWLKYRHDRAFALSHRDEITGYVRRLIGLPFTTSPLTEDAATLRVAPLRLLKYAGLLTQRPRSAVTLEGLLHDYWDGLAVRVEQFLGRWMALSEDDLTRVGAANSDLGVNTIVGDEVYDLRSTIGVTCGPVSWAEFLEFLPDSTRFAQTQAWIKLFLVDPMAVRLNIRIRAGEVPQTRLSSGEGGARLGFTTWAACGAMPETTVTFDASWTRLN